MPSAAVFSSTRGTRLVPAIGAIRALFSELYAAPARPVNNARFVFLDARAETFYDNWERVAGECVAILRWAAGRDPHDCDPTFQTSSASSRHTAKRSAPAGRRTMYVSTTPASSTFTI